MRSTNTFSILFLVNQKNKNDNQALLYARITVNGKRVNLSLKRKIDVSLWDSKEKGQRNDKRSKTIKFVFGSNPHKIISMLSRFEIQGRVNNRSTD